MQNIHPPNSFKARFVKAHLLAHFFPFIFLNLKLLCFFNFTRSQINILCMAQYHKFASQGFNYLISISALTSPQHQCINRYVLDMVRHGDVQANTIYCFSFIDALETIKIV